MATATRFSIPTSAWMWVAVAAIGTLYIGSTLLTPLYPLYREEFGFSELVVTEIYAAYALGNLAVLFWFGRLSDQLGRRRTALVALACTLVSALIFLLAQGTAWLFAGRVVNGFAAGLGAGAVTAWIVELEAKHDQARAATLAASGNLAGLGAGAIIAGVLAQFGPAPMRLSFALFAVVLVAMMAAVFVAPETVRNPVTEASELSLTPRVGIPSGIRMAFVSPAAMAFATFALGGFYAALIPGIVTGTLDNSNLAVVGAVVALFFGGGSATAAVTGKLEPRTAMFCALAFMLPGLALLVAAESFESMGLLVLASACGGAGMALGYRSSLQVVNRIAPKDKRAEVVSTFLLLCYLGNSLPVVGVGLLARATGAPFAHEVFAALLAVLACVGTGVGAKFLPRE